MEVSVHGQSALLLLDQDEAEHHGRVGREGQTQAISLGLPSDRELKLDSKYPLWAFVLKLVPIQVLCLEDEGGTLGSGQC